MGGLSAASQARISVPQDISFVCFDDDPLFKTMSATMTCVSQDLTSMGKHAVELLLKRIHGDYTDFPKIDMLDVVFHPLTPVAGTTRDVVEQAVRLGDIRLNLFDTAGLRDTEDVIEAEGIRRSWKKLDEAGLVLAVFDGSEPLTREDLALARKCAGRPAIALINKEDKLTRFDAEVIAPYFAMVLPVCCQEEGARDKQVSEG